jgi:hypothetical protein
MKNIRPFLRQLRVLITLGWKAKFIGGKAIRLRKPGEKAFCLCPITALCLANTGKHFSVHEYRLAACHIKMRRGKMQQTVVDSADNRNVISNQSGQRTRTLLLRALNLKEVA